MTYDLSVPSQLLAALLPDLVLMVGAMAVMLYAAMRPDSAEHQRAVGIASLGLVVVAIGAVLYMALRGDSASGGVIAVDGFRWAVDLVILVAAAGTVALGIEYNDREGITHGEFHVLVLFAAAGMMILGAARDLMILFLGIEIMSVAVYVLAGLNRRSARSAEAALKYFLLGAFATGFMLYGIALVYGATGATQIAVIGQRVSSYGMLAHPMLLTGIALLTIGLGFKVAAVPFHMWAPDVYDGAPTPVTAFMAAAVKAAAFAAFVRVWYEGFQMPIDTWAPALWWLAVLTMVVGNLIALQQQNLKRLLAYSSIVHSGYLLVAILANSPLGSSAFVFYVFAYTLATFGAFGIIAAVQPGGDRPAMMADVAGLWHVRPWLAVGMGVFLLALLGFPIFGGVGFFAKWYLLRAALDARLDLNMLAVILVVTSVVSAGYYLQVVRVMFMQPRPEGAAEVPAVGPYTRSVLVAVATLILFFGIYPTPLATWSQSAAFDPITASTYTGTISDAGFGVR